MGATAESLLLVMLHSVLAVSPALDLHFSITFFTPLSLIFNKKCAIPQVQQLQG